MRVLTLNTWQERGPWRERWEIIFDWIRRNTPALVFFQEIFNPAWIAEIQQRTGLTTAVYHEPSSGLAIFSKWPLGESANLRYAAQSAREDYGRFALYAKLKLPAGELCVFNTHLSWKLEDGAVREGQTRELAAWMGEKAGGLAVMAAGDFNSTAWTSEIKGITAAGLTDVFACVNPGQPGLTWSYDNPYTREGKHPLPDRRIDYIFVKNAKAVIGEARQAEVVMTESVGGCFASDHFGVAVRFLEQENDSFKS